MRYVETDSIKRCSVCSTVIGRYYIGETSRYRNYYTKGKNLFLCSECNSKDPYKIIEELLQEINELGNKVETSQ